jgi:(p)ppGpp synthase/HD superfamily hydrolase
LSQLEKAIAIALQAHEGTVDKAGQPYILHPLQLMMQMDSDEARITAVLHDVVEDSDITLADLANSGFSAKVLDALALLTHNKESVTYADYIAAIKGNPLAKKVKLADLEHNMNIRRLQTPLSEEDLKRLNNYRLAWDVLRNS